MIRRSGSVIHSLNRGILARSRLGSRLEDSVHAYRCHGGAGACERCRRYSTNAGISEITTIARMTSEKLS